MNGVPDIKSVALAGEEFYLINEVLEKRFGLYFPEHKRAILESRLRPRLHALHLWRFRDYYFVLQSDPGEVQRLATLVTNNETYFFRERYQFTALINELRQDVNGRDIGSTTLRVLCAGCSSGEEAYTIKFYTQDNRESLTSLYTEINAFDVDPVRVVMARQAEYRPRSLREMSEDQIGRYLTPAGPERYSVKAQYRSGVDFSSGNLMDLRSFRRPQPYDVVFCRNALIYFSEAAFRWAIDNLAEVLRPGGWLFLGHSESIIGMTNKFESVRLDGCMAYRRLAA